MVEGNGLENRRAGNGTEGSNPSLSATMRIHAPKWLLRETQMEDGRPSPRLRSMQEPRE